MCLKRKSPRDGLETEIRTREVLLIKTYKNSYVSTEFSFLCCFLRCILAAGSDAETAWFIRLQKDDTAPETSKEEKYNIVRNAALFYILIFKTILQHGILAGALSGNPSYRRCNRGIAGVVHNHFYAIYRAPSPSTLTNSAKKIVLYGTDRKKTIIKPCGATEPDRTSWGKRKRKRRSKCQNTEGGGRKDGYLKPCTRRAPLGIGGAGEKRR